MARIGICLFVALLAAPGALVAQSPAAGDWQQIAESNQGQIYLDRRSVEHSGSLAAAWFRTDLKQRGDDGEDLWMDRRQVDCSARRIRLLSFAEYRRDGSQVISVADAGGNWSEIPAGSLAEAIHRLLCG